MSVASTLPRATHIPRTLHWYHYGRQDVCFETTSPECGESVYFVRHNDGCVWLDSLGWPWPKHRHCNDAADYLNRFLTQIIATRHGIEATPILGRIVKRIHRSFDLLYLVVTETGQLASLSAPPNLAHLLSGIVVLRFTEEGLLLDDISHNPVHVKDVVLASQPLEAYLHESAFDVHVGWQPPSDPPRRSGKRKR